MRGASKMGLGSASPLRRSSCAVIHLHPPSRRTSGYCSHVDLTWPCRRPTPRLRGLRGRSVAAPMMGGRRRQFVTYIRSTHTPFSNHVPYACSIRCILRAASIATMARLTYPLTKNIGLILLRPDSWLSLRRLVLLLSVDQCLHTARLPALQLTLQS